MSKDQLGFDIVANLDKLEKGLSKASNSIEKFSKNNDKRFKNFGKSVTDLGKNLSVKLTGSITVLTGAMFGLAKNVGNISDRILDLSDITGMGTDAIQEYQYVAKQAGVSTEAMTTAVEGLTRRLVSNSEAGSAALQIMDSLGIETKTTSGEIRNAGDIMDDAIKVLSDMENATERNALGAQMFGGAWKDLAPILSMGSKGIADARQEARDLGIVLDSDALNGANEFRKATAKLTAQMEGLKNQIGAKLAPIMTNTLIPAIQKHVIPLFQKLGDFIEKAINWFSGLESGTKKIILVITGLAAALGPVLVAIGGVISFMPVLIAGFGALISPVGLVVAGIIALTVAIVKNWDTVKKWAQDTVNFFIRIYNESIVFRTYIEALTLQFKTMYNVVSFVVNSIWEIIKMNFGNAIDVIKGFGGVIEGVLTLNPAKIKESAKEAAKALTTNISTAFGNIKKNAEKLFEDISSDVDNALQKSKDGKAKFVDFTSKPEALEKLSKDVEDAVAKGATKGLGRAKIGGISELEPTTEAQRADVQPVGELFQREAITENIHGITEEMLMFQQDMDNLIMGSIAQTFSNLGSVIGDALSGGKNVAENIGKAILGGFANFLGELGDMLIQYGLFAKSKGKIDLAVNAGGFAAIAAGASGVALGVALKAISSAIGNRTQGGFSGSGGGSGATAVSGGSTSSFTQSRSGNNEVVFRIQYDQLVGVLRNGNELNNIIGG